MKNLLRSLQLFHTAGKYRLDDLAQGYSLPPTAKILFGFYHLYPRKKASRGARLRLALEELGPIYVKFGQLLSTRPDLIPEDIFLELSKLQDNVSPFDKHEFKNLVETSLEGKVDELFASFETEPLASASVAQVHGAVLKSGKEVVIKVIRPGIEKRIERDIQLLYRIAHFIENKTIDGKRLHPVDVVADYEITIFNELDLVQEAANATQLKRNWKDSPLLYVPEIYWEFTSANVMVMERIDGIPVTDIAALKAQNTDLKKLAERGVEIFFTQVFDHNFFHADMHPGNIFVSRENPRNPKYMGVDMAIMGSLTREDQYYLARNLLAMFRRDYRQVAELHINSGWVPEGTPVGAFESAVRSVCEPVFAKPLKEISFGHAVMTIFKVARRFNMPVQPQLVLLQKTLLNTEGLGRQLYPDLNLWDTAHPYLEKWIRRRYHPKTLWKEFKYYAPEWMEKLPQMPGMLHDSLQQISRLEKLTPELIATSQELREEKIKRQKKSRLRKLLAIASASTALLVNICELSFQGINSQNLTVFFALLAVVFFLSS